MQQTNNPEKTNEQTNNKKIQGLDHVQATSIILVDGEMSPKPWYFPKYFRGFYCVSATIREP